MSETTEQKTKRKITNLLLSGVVRYRYSFFFPDGEWERGFIPNLRKVLRTVPHYQLTLAKTIDSSRSWRRPKDAPPQIYLMSFTHERVDYRSHSKVYEFLRREKVKLKKDGFQLREERLWFFAMGLRDKPLDDFDSYLGEGHNLKRITEINKHLRPSQVAPLPRLLRKDAKNQDWPGPKTEAEDDLISVPTDPAPF